MKRGIVSVRVSLSYDPLRLSLCFVILHCTHALSARRGHATTFFRVGAVLHVQEWVAGLARKGEGRLR